MGLHQTWRDIYCTYWKSHYHPSFDLQVLYISYFLLISQTSLGYLPMFLITTAMVFWIISPVIFGPLPKMNLMQQDLRQFGAFINSKVGMGADEIPEVIKRGGNGKFRSLYECGLADELETWTLRPKKVLGCFVFTRLFVLYFIILALPGSFFDFTKIWLALLSVQWAMLFFFLLCDRSNILLLPSMLVWCVAPYVGTHII